MREVDKLAKLVRETLIIIVGGYWLIVFTMWALVLTGVVNV